MAYYQDKKGNLVKLTDKAFEKRDSKDYTLVGLNLHEALENTPTKRIVRRPPKKSTNRGKS